MTSTQRQALFDRLLNEIARGRAKRLGLSYAGTIRKLPPPPLPGERQGFTRYFVNTVSPDGRRARVAELGATADARLRRAERWASTGEGTAPVLAPGGRSRSR